MKTTIAVRILVAAVILPVGIYILFQLGASGNAELPDEPHTPPPVEAPTEALIEQTPEEPVEETDPSLLILVNKENGLDRDYKPEDLAAIRYYAADRSAEGRFMREEAADAFHALVEEAERGGLQIVVTTAYRSYDFQSSLYSGYVAKDGQAAADKYSARPGHSEHQTGLAADVSAQSVGFALTTAFAGTEEGKWLAENAHSFGFILRYPAGKEELTGYQHEPWHIRYVGAAAAAYIHEKGITLEEYLEIMETEE